MDNIFISLIVFLITVIVVLAIGKLYGMLRANQRFTELIGDTRVPSVDQLIAHKGAKAFTNIDSLINSLSKLSLPEAGWQDSAVRLKFIRAGFRHSSGIKIFYAIKSILAFVIPGVLFFLLWNFGENFTKFKIFFFVIIVAAVGYYLPDFYMRIRTSRRLQLMQDALPDLIDLLVICTESGLGVDAAITRVAKDSTARSPLLSKEFYLVSLEIRAGVGRVEALKNMVLRTNLEDLNSFVSMLIQADKFGASIVESLRIQSEMMRIKRMQRAEEKAAKIPVKMLLPLILFIFPVLMIVLIGPAIMQISAMFAK